VGVKADKNGHYVCSDGQAFTLESVAYKHEATCVAERITRDTENLRSLLNTLASRKTTEVDAFGEIRSALGLFSSGPGAVIGRVKKLEEIVNFLFEKDGYELPSHDELVQMKAGYHREIAECVIAGLGLADGMPSAELVVLRLKSVLQQASRVDRAIKVLDGKCDP